MNICESDFMLYSRSIHARLRVNLFAATSCSLTLKIFFRSIAFRMSSARFQRIVSRGYIHFAITWYCSSHKSAMKLSGYCDDLIYLLLIVMVTSLCKFNSKLHLTTALMCVLFLPIELHWVRHCKLYVAWCLVEFQRWYFHNLH